uniref:Uncharacterized protein n=1 Tax=Trichogramma kaykai TaxID=54128 RepID=A0ABD2XE55_9HYME
MLPWFKNSYALPYGFPYEFLIRKNLVWEHFYLHPDIPAKKIRKSSLRLISTWFTERTTRAVIVFKKLRLPRKSHLRVRILT